MVTVQKGSLEEGQGTQTLKSRDPLSQCCFLSPWTRYISTFCWSRRKWSLPEGALG